MCRQASMMMGVAILLGCLAMMGCGHSQKLDVKGDFLSEHPDYNVVEISAEEGIGSTVYNHIRFSKPGESLVCEVVWGYQQAKPGWRVFYKSQPALPGSLCKGCSPKPCK
jgi:hypothetical protein